jgi:hypothetical protein
MQKSNANVNITHMFTFIHYIPPDQGLPISLEDAHRMKALEWTREGKGEVTYTV